MFKIFHELNLISISFRILLSIVMGGIIGINRESISRPAGLRTHVLVCLGTTLAMITAQYIHIEYGELSDPARIASQIISGIGFIGAGSIIIDKKRVKGLTTAAGLWATACMGIAIGIGFYSAAIIGGFCIFMTLVFLSKFSRFLKRRSDIVYLYLELKSENSFFEVCNYFKKTNIKILDTEWSERVSNVNEIIGVFIKIKLPKKNMHSKFINKLEEMPSVIYINDLE